MNVEDNLDSDNFYDFWQLSGYAVVLCHNVRHILKITTRKGFFSETIKNEQVYMHNHYCFEINLALSSGGTYYIGDSLYPIDKGVIFGDSVLTFFDLFLKLLDSHLRRLDSTDMLKHFFLIDFLNYYFCRNIAPFKI